jgi:hypothetical protein
METKEEALALPTPEQIKEQAKKAKRAPQRNPETGRFLSKKDPEFKHIQKVRAQKALTDLGDILETNDLTIKKDDTAWVQMIKATAQCVLSNSDENSASKSKAVGLFAHLLGADSLAKEDDGPKGLTVVLPDPFAGLSVEERAKLISTLPKVEDESHPWGIPPKKPSWVDDPPVIDAEILSAPDSYKTPETLTHEDSRDQAKKD